MRLTAIIMVGFATYTLSGMTAFQEVRTAIEHAKKRRMVIDSMTSGVELARAVSSARERVRAMEKCLRTFKSHPVVMNFHPKLLDADDFHVLDTELGAFMKAVDHKEFLDEGIRSAAIELFDHLDSCYRIGDWYIRRMKKRVVRENLREVCSVPSGFLIAPPSISW